MKQFETIDEYLSNMQPDQLASFEHIRALVHRIAPDGTESISYGMPAFKYQGKPLLYVGAFKDHMSLFPTSGPIEAMKDQLVGFTVAKGTIQFTPDKPIPDEIITQLLRIRIAQIAEQ